MVCIMCLASSKMDRMLTSANDGNFTRCLSIISFMQMYVDEEEQGHFDCDDTPVEKVQQPNVSSCFRNLGPRQQPLLPKEYIWWDLMVVMVATELYKPEEEPGTYMS